MGVMNSTCYAGIDFLMALENVFPPIPSEFIMSLAGFPVTQDKLSFLFVVLAGVLRSLLGSLLFYYPRRKLGEDRLMRYAEVYGKWLTVSQKDLQGAKRWFDRHGNLAVLL